MTSPYVHSVSHAFTRTQRTVSPPSFSLIAFTTFSRAATFPSVETESSRSRNTMSAPRPGALPSIFSLEPGTDRHARRGRLRLRSDMSERVRRPPRPAPFGATADGCQGMQRRELALRLRRVGARSDVGRNVRGRGAARQSDHHDVSIPLGRSRHGGELPGWRGSVGG